MRNTITKIIRSAGRAGAMCLSPAIRRGGLYPAVAAAEAYFAFLVGKGAGSGWDLAAEVKAATGAIHRRDAVIFDIGANDGRWSAAVANAIGSSTLRFFLFECSPQVLPYLSKHIHGIPNPLVTSAAISDHDGTIEIYAPSRGSGLGSVYERRDVGIAKEDYKVVSVKAITIDAFVRQHSIRRIDLLKMDIEGHELAALHGAEDSLRDHTIQTLTFEFGSANINSRTFFRDYFDYLSKFGYKLHRIGPGGALFPVAVYYEDLEYFRGATNYIAFRS